MTFIFTACQSIEKEEYNNNPTEEEQVEPEVKGKNSPGARTRREEGIVVSEIPDFTYSKMEQMIEELTEKYKGIKVDTIGSSLAGRKLYLLKLGEGNKKINVVGGFHGRESITSILILRLLEDYASHQNDKVGGYNLKKILQDTTFYFIPMLNPDGVEIAINGIDNESRSKEFYLEANQGSKDFDRWKANGRGVDLNDQFPAHWQDVKSADGPHFEEYKGPAPESEPESKALARLTREEDFDLVVAFHNSGSIIYWYYNQTGDRYRRDLQLAQKIGDINGYQVVVPEDSARRAAGYKDWFVNEFKKPGFTIEVGDGKAEEPLPSSQLSRYFRENRTVLLELAQ